MVRRSSQSGAEGFNGGDCIRESRRSFHFRMVDRHLLGVRSRPLGLGICEVGGQIVECGSNAGELFAEPIEHCLRSSLWPPGIVVQQDEGDVVPVLGLAPGVGGSALCEQKPARAR